MNFFLLALALSLALSGCGGQRESPKEDAQGGSMDGSLAAKIRRFAPTEIAADTSHLSENDRRALDKIIEAARYMDAIFLRQVWSGNVDLKKKLESDTTPAGRERLHYFKINVGPWSRLDKNEPFIEGVPHERVRLLG
jgi:hypothetical protein